MTPEQTAAPATAPCCTPIGDAALSEAEAVELAGALKALADPVRLRLASIVAASPTGEACACDLPDAVGRSQPTVSHHLSVLVDAGILTRDQRGKWAWFSLAHSRLASICATLSPGATDHDRPAAHPCST